MSWLRKEPIGPFVTTALNQLLRDKRDAAAHQAMPTENHGVTMAPDRATDAALVDAGLTDLDFVKGTVLIKFADGDYAQSTDTTKREYLRIRNDWTLARGVPCFIKISDRLAVNTLEIIEIAFEAAPDEAQQIYDAIQQGAASIGDLRSFASSPHKDRHAGH